GGAPLRRRRVRPGLLQQRDRARSPRAPSGIRRGVAPRRPRLVRADAGVELPDRAARAAAGRALAARALPQALLEARRGGRLGGHLPAAQGRAGEAVRGACLWGEGGPVYEELDLCEEDPALPVIAHLTWKPPWEKVWMSLVKPTMKRTRTSAKPTTLARSMTAKGTGRPRTFSASAQKMCPPSSGRKGKRLMMANDSETMASRK